MELDDKCRTCLRMAKQPENLFNGDNTLLEKIKAISSVEIVQSSELPSQICEECLTNIRYFYNFRKVLINTALDLQTRLETLKKTNYFWKPRSDLNYFVPENVNVKTESDLQNNIDLSNADSNVIEDNSVERVLKCEHCKELFTSGLELTIHNHKQNTEVACNSCGSATSLNTHKPLYSGGDSYTCKVSHKSVHSKPTFICKICGESFRWKWQCTKHVKRTHKGASKRASKDIPNIVKCPDCEETFSSRIQLRKHRRTHHLTGVCTVCGVIMRADNLPKHVKGHTDGPCTCDICGKTVKNSESLRFHRARHSEHKEYPCDICGTTMNSKRNYYRHLKCHKDPNFRKVACSVCGKKVVGLKRHMLSHTGGRPYSCTYCEKGFTSPYALKVHTRQHTKERPFICEYCSDSFPQKVSLKTHLKSKHGIAG